MVKKGSFLSRLADRWRSPSGVRIETERTARTAPPREKVIEKAAAKPAVAESGNGRADARREAPKPTPQPQAAARPESAKPEAAKPEPVRPEPVRPEPIRPEAFELPSSHFAGEQRSTRKMSEREEAMLALGGHFQELAQLMRGVHTRMDSQLGRLVETATSLQSLPALQNQQLDMLRGIAAHMERQNSLGEQIARSLHGMPELMKNVETALQRAAASDERTSATMREFQGTMDRIHSAMGRMVEHSEQQAKATQSIAQHREESLQSLATSIETSQQASVRELRQAHEEGLQSLRRTHEDQSNRLQRVVQEHAGWNKAVLFGLGLVALGMAATLVVLFLKS